LYEYANTNLVSIEPTRFFLFLFADDQRLQQRLASVTAQDAIIRNVFQSLVLESGVNWAEDPAFAELILSLGQPSVSE